MGAKRPTVIAGPLEIGKIGASPIFDVGKAECGFVVEVDNLRHKHHLGVVVCAEPAD